MQKKLLLFLISLLSLSLLSSQAWAIGCADAVACYLFTEGSGTTVADSSPNANTGNFKGEGEPAWQEMAWDGAPAYLDYNVDVDATDDFIDCRSDTTVDDIFTNGGSYVAWAKVEGIGEEDFGYFFGKTPNGSILGPRLFTQNSGTSTNVIGFGFVSSGGISHFPQRITSNSIYANGTKFHISAIKDDNSIKYTSMHIYINGSEATYTSGSDGATSLSSDASYSLILGNRTGLDRSFNGDLAEQAFFKGTVLTSTQINAIMENGLNPASPPATRRRMMLIQ